MLLKSSKIILVIVISIALCIVDTSAFSLPSPALSIATKVVCGKLSNGVVSTTTQATRIRTSYTSLSMRNGDDNTMSGTKCALSCLPYLLLMLDGNKYGRFIFALVPALVMVNYVVLGPFKALYIVVPFLQFGLFIGLTLLAQNPEIPRPVRFNLQQAVILDILLFFPTLLGEVTGLFAPLFLVESGSNFVFYDLVATVGYSVVSNVIGKIPDQIPVVSEAVEMQIGRLSF